MECNSLMAVSSDKPNLVSRQIVRVGRNDAAMNLPYDPNMARKKDSPSVIGPDWFLVEWMRAKKMTQAELMRRTGWGKATANDIYHGRTGYYRQILNEAASALHVQPYELLMLPEEANNLRQMRESALRIAETQPREPQLIAPARKRAANE